MAGEDLTAEALEELLGKRPLQSHRVLLSTASTAIEWAGAGAPSGAVVVADAQIAARGRAGRPWKITPGEDLAFAFVLRPQLEAEREGFLYTVVLAGLADVCGPDATIEWPDRVCRGDEVMACIGIEIRLSARGVKWAVVNVLLPNVPPPRGPLLSAALEAVEARLAASDDDVLEDHRERCTTIGRRMRVQLLGGNTRLQGPAVDTIDDGSLVLELGGDGGGETRLVPVRPQDVSLVADA